MKIHKQIKKIFNETTIPVYVEGVDIKLGKKEILYTATKNDKRLDFVIRDNIVMVTHWEDI